MRLFTKFEHLSNRSRALVPLVAIAAAAFAWGAASGAAQSAKPVRPHARLTRYEYTEYHMGVDVRIVLYAPDKPEAETACAAAFERFAELDTAMSDYRVDSELNRLCAKAGGPAVRVSADLFRPLQRAQELARLSGGAFDATCGPVVRLWRKARKEKALPPPSEIAAAAARTGWRYVELNAAKRTVRLRKPGMQLDLGAIGKGYADDCAQEVLRRHGISSALVEAGGDIVVTDAPPGQPGWRIEVPNSGDAGARPRTFANCAISTSGDLEQSAAIGGKRYSHVVDPRTGWPLTNRIQVTVIARDGLTSDGLSTAVSVLGPIRGRELARRYPGTTVYIRFASGEPDTPSPGRFQPPN
ncbi:MAG TPA: FAD:protein FMN transferase [Chthonomonadaceae bacterium]|nr:FAD:protein FMN transferase [Chthonomonadaceae bacterium]